ncbi:FAD-dependent oxidoreductase [Candidatus Saccharibacteria bacterium]|nr:FAD-dependent oxidoreductase [Candidatus Saccharibacteria bacterium]
MYDIAIIGGGVAGLTAAIYGVRANQRVVVIEAMACGGQIINTSEIDNYPAAAHISGMEFGEKLQSQAEDLDVEIRYEQVSRVQRVDKNSFTITTDRGELKSHTVILATGTDYRKLGIENEDALIGRGISYCATCDGGFYRDKIVAVNGGGNTALEEALYLSDLCKKVYLIHRRDQFRGEDAMIKLVHERPNIELVLSATIESLVASEDSGKLIALKISRGDLLSVDGLFVAIGRVPRGTDLIDGLKLDEHGYVVADESCSTNIDGLFVAGDVRTKTLRQLVTAASDGAAAANAALAFLRSSKL